MVAAKLLNTPLPKAPSPRRAVVRLWGGPRVGDGLRQRHELPQVLGDVDHLGADKAKLRDADERGDELLAAPPRQRELPRQLREAAPAAPLPAPVAPEPPTRAPTPAPEPTVPATWLDLMRSLQADGASPYPLPPRARRPR